MFSSAWFSESKNREQQQSIDELKEQCIDELKEQCIDELKEQCIESLLGIKPCVCQVILFLIYNSTNPTNKYLVVFCSILL